MGDLEGAGGIGRVGVGGAWKVLRMVGDGVVLHGHMAGGSWSSWLVLGGPPQGGSWVCSGCCGITWMVDFVRVLHG